MNKSIILLKDKNNGPLVVGEYLGQLIILLFAELGAKVLCVDLSQKSYILVESLSISYNSIPPEYL